MTAGGITPGTGKFSWKQSNVPAKLARKRAAKGGEELEAAAAPNAPTPTAQGASEAPGWVGTGASNVPPATPPSPTISAASSSGQGTKTGSASGAASNGSSFPSLAPSVRKIEPRPRVVPRPAIAPALEPGEIPEEELEAEPSPRRSRRRRSEESLTGETSGGAGERRRGRPSPSSSRSDVGGGMGSHQCETCGKVYKHRNCLTKHGWEHHESWALTKKWCQTKHQQVQMLEAAQVLVEMTKISVEGRRIAMDPSPSK